MFSQTTIHRAASLLRRALVGLAGGAVLLLPGVHAAGADCPIFSGSDLIVPNNCTYVISGSEAYQNVKVKAGGTLELAAGAILRVTNSVCVHPRGAFKFTATSGTQPTLRATEQGVTLDGLLEVTGSVGGALDRAGNLETVQLLSGGEIRCTGGPLTISLPFENDGTVTANGAADGDDIIFNLSVISNGSTGTFQVTTANSELTFLHSGTPSLTGDADFDVAAGVMLFKSTLTTAGGFRQTGGSLKVDANKTFTATGDF
ncbi:MAG: hypothetical protein V3T70_05430 [Phycisphaerae bacterium]